MDKVSSALTWSTLVFVAKEIQNIAQNVRWTNFPIVTTHVQIQLNTVRLLL